MSNLSTPVQPVNPILDPIAEAERITNELSARIDAMCVSMQKAMDLLAEACGAWHCLNCGEWTTEMVTLESHSDEMGTETTEGCTRCAGGN